MNAMMKTLSLVLFAVALAAPAGAQTRRPAAVPEPDPSTPVSIRPFFLVTAEQMAAKRSFDAIFGQSFEPFFGGGVNVALKSGIWIELAVSRFEKTGQRAFSNDGQTFQLGIPLTASITPIELSGGYRFRLRNSPRIWPYIGAGVGSYGYDESSAGSIAADNVSVRHLGYLAVGGVEGRIQKWISLSGDVQFTRVMGILGASGLSKDLGENDLGGIAIRIKVIVGK